MADKHLFFDMDDTLIKCSGYFYDVEDAVANKILEYTNKYTFEELKAMFNEKQIENIEEHGYGPDNFKFSLMQVGSEVIGYDFFKDDLASFISQTAQVLYDSPIELLDGVEETIKYLHDKGYEMHIITKGSVKVQTDRLERMPIREYFKNHYIVKHKLKSDYEEILKSCKLEADNCFMIGNSPKGDINEAKLAGLNTIFIPNDQTWSPEDEAISEALPKTFELENILEMKMIL